MVTNKCLSVLISLSFLAVLFLPGLKNVRAQEEGKTTVKEESGISITKEGCS